MDAPVELRYTVEHEWVRPPSGGSGGGNVVRVGITDFAQDALGDIVYVSLPALGATLTAGQPCGELESTKSVSDLYAPVTGTVVALNESVDASPEKVNLDPYGDGWLFEVELADPAELGALLDADRYAATLDS